jgi:hypothetical protein
MTSQTAGGENSLAATVAANKTKNKSEGKENICYTRLL